MPPLKRKRKRDDESGTSDNTVIEISDDEDGSTPAAAVPQDGPPPAKKTRSEELSSCDQNLPLTTLASSNLQADASGYAEEAWGKDRATACQMIDRLVNTLQHSLDQSLIKSIAGISSYARSLELHPGRSPGYIKAQKAMSGNSSLFNRLPGEIRKMIWRLASLPRLDCCFAGLRRHNAIAEGNPADLKEIEIAFTHASEGRGLHINRQILEESRHEAQPTGFVCCTSYCATTLTASVGMAYNNPSCTERIVRRDRKLRSVSLVRCQKGKKTDRYLLEACLDSLNKKKSRSTAPLDVECRWTLRLEAEYYIFEKVSISS